MQEDNGQKPTPPEEVSVDDLIKRARGACLTMGDGNPNKRLIAQLATGIKEVSLRLGRERELFDGLVMAVEELLKISAAASAAARAAGSQMAIHEVSLDHGPKVDAALTVLDGEYRKLVHEGAVIPEAPKRNLVIM